MNQAISSATDSKRRVMAMAGSSYCEKHRQEMRGIAKPFNLGVIFFCDDCGKETEIFESEKRAREEAIKKQCEINKRLENAMITPRFQDKLFTNFNAVTDAQKKVLQGCLDFVERMQNQKVSTGLLFSGKPGTGKNHLACATVKAILTSTPKTAVITTTMKMIRAIKASWKEDGDEDKAMWKFVSPDILVIDEVGVQFGSLTEKIYLTEIINDRYEWMKPTFLLSNNSPQELNSILGERIVDRFRDEGSSCLIFDWESHRGKNG